jgi:nifR3 family TIM-barrel protein
MTTMQSMPLRIGSISIDSNLTLAPLAGYTSLPFRLILREIGGVGLCTSDLVNARSLIERNRNAFKLIETRPCDRPLAIQLFGAVAEEMRDAALLLESRGVEMVDVNMGCPVPKVCKIGGGVTMMRHPEKTLRLVRMMTAAVRIPVTCKIRLGWDGVSLNLPDFVRALADAGVAAITVHGRTGKQGFSGTVSLAGIRSVVEAVRSIPVIGNGDVVAPQGVRAMIDATGCAGVSIGRGAFHNPWIFRETRRFLDTGEVLPGRGVDDRLQLMERHLELMVEVFGEEPACRMFRKIAALYARGLGPSAEFKRQVTRLQCRAQWAGIVAAYRDWRQEVLSSKNPTGSGET